MTNVVALIQHRRLSGHKSGRSSERDTPVSRSIDNTNSAGAPLFERLSQYQTNGCRVPIRDASEAWPPAISHARCSALTDMGAIYPNLDKLQSKNALRTHYPVLGKNGAMRGTDSKAFGERIKQRREELGWSQHKLAKECGKSQPNIEWIEKGGPKDPTKQAIRLAEALGVASHWLLTGTGSKETRPHVMTREQLRKLYDALPHEGQLEVRIALSEIMERYLSKNKRA